jgi:hypothetical protein
MEGFILTITDTAGTPAATLRATVVGPWEGGQGRVNIGLDVEWADGQPAEHYECAGVKGDIGPVALANEMLTSLVWGRLAKLAEAEAEAIESPDARGAELHRPDFGAAVPRAA